MDHEQRINMKFCFKLQKSAKETHKMLKLVYGDAAVTMKTIYKWLERFRKGCESVEDQEKSGRPSTSKAQENVERVSEMFRSNRRFSIREIAEDLNISYDSVQNILAADLNMRQASAKFDNAPCHTSLLVRQFLSNKNIMVCPHPPYSLDVASYDFWIFPKVIMTMKGKRFESINDTEATTTVQLKTLTKEDFQNCFRKWQERWDKCVRSEGD